MTAIDLPAPGAVLRGVGLYVGAVFVGACMDVLIKLASDAHPISQIVFFRSFFGLVPLLLWAVPRGGWRSLVPRRPVACLSRGLVQAAAALFFFLSFRELPLADAYAIGFTAPLMIALLSAPLLGERVGGRRWAAILVGFAGVLVMLKPGGEGTFSLGALAALAGAFFYALSAVLIRRLSREETTAAIAVSATVTMAGVSALSAPLGWTLPDLAGWTLLVGVGLLGGVLTILFTAAFRMAPASVLAPFEYTAMLWGVGFGMAVWGDMPTLGLAAGSAIVVGSGLALLRAEAKDAPK
ncbi:MAG TPA: DMT family transporter [Azospirillaceae bacterium]|nr:DMT family transporter [Azospirillaceae bacterium]